MLEWCSKPRMLALVGLLLLISSLFIFLFGEYVEKNLGTNKFFQRQPIAASNPIKETETQHICPIINISNLQNATATKPKLLQSCQKCSDFERNALRSEYCRPSGYFDSYRCAGVNGTNSIVYRACINHMQGYEERSFYVFSFLSFFFTALFWTFVRWRKEYLEIQSFSAKSYQPLDVSVR